MIGLILYLTGLLVAASCGVLAALSDLRGMKIPNIYPAIIFGAFFVSFAGVSFSGYGAEFATLTAHFITAGLVFVITFILFLTIKFGAGDSKLLTAYAIWFAPMALVPFLISMSVIGAVLSLFAIYVHRRKPVKEPKEGSWIYKLQNGESVVPYGIAITGGAIVAFLSQGYLSPSTLECFLQTACG